MSERIDEGNNTKIMVVDDDLEISQLLKMALQKHGYNVFGFTEPLMALEHFKTNHYACNLIISDFRMPEMDGLELLRNIKLLNPKTRALLLTAFDVSGDTEFADLQDKGVINGLIQKPVTIKKLYELVDSQLRGQTK